ncbi:hypothetical protein I4U23_023725 [Adineta vaga]|nr:hypothetical protein I4U23_023725 [Adineta vaga]
MFAEKPVFPTSKFCLPPIGQSVRRKPPTPPTPSSVLTDSTNTYLTDNLTELKTKYSDYTTWLKTSTRHSRGPVVTQALLKNSLCQMGIDLAKAEQLVSTCSWYVYQFQKELKNDSRQKDPLTTLESKKTHSNNTKSKKLPSRKFNADDSLSTIASSDKDDSLPSNTLNSMRNNQFVLPAIHVSDLSTNSRYRHVDFHSEQAPSRISNPPSTHWRSALVKTRILSKLQPLSRKSSNNNSPLDMHSNNFHRGLAAGHTRSILRKQTSSSSSIASTDITSRKIGSRILTPSSTIADDVPLGTRSKRLFGGSDCFAQIMNELEQHTDY